MCAYLYPFDKNVQAVTSDLQLSFLGKIPEPTLEAQVLNLHNADQSIPNDSACFGLWDKYGMLENIKEHSYLVAKIATAIAEALADKGYRINIAAVRSAALLHDIAKTYSIYHGGSHAQIGASWVKYLTNNPLIAQGVLLHVLWPWQMPNSEERIATLPFIIMYSDKRTMHDMCVDLETRHQDLMERYGHSEPAKRSIQESLRQGKYIEEQFEKILGSSLNGHTFDRGWLVN